MRRKHPTPIKAKVTQQHNKDESKKNDDKTKSHQGEEGSHPGGASKNLGGNKKLDGECFNYGKRTAWPKIGGQKGRSPLRVMPLLLALKRKTKMTEMLKRHWCGGKRISSYSDNHETD